MSLKIVGPWFHIEDSLIWNCVQLRKVAKSKYDLHEKIGNLNISCKRYEIILASIFKKWRDNGLWTRFWSLIVKRKTLNFEEVFNWENLHNHTSPPPTKFLCNWRFLCKRYEQISTSFQRKRRFEEKLCYGQIFGGWLSKEDY